MTTIGVAIVVVQFSWSLLFIRSFCVCRAHAVVVGNRTFSINRTTRDSPHKCVRHQFAFGVLKFIGCQYSLWIFAFFSRLWQQKHNFHLAHNSTCLLTLPHQVDFPVCVCVIYNLCDVVCYLAVFPRHIRIRRTNLSGLAFCTAFGLASVVRLNEFKWHTKYTTYRWWMHKHKHIK